MKALLLRVYHRFGGWKSGVKVRVAFLLNQAGVRLLTFAQGLVRSLDAEERDSTTDWYVPELARLHAAIRQVLRRQLKEYPSYAYFWGFPYQSLGLLNILGGRGSEERYEAYGLDALLRPGQRVLDVGCNCGFLGLLAALRTGCVVDGIDINPYAVEIGSLCASFLKLGDRVRLTAGDFRGFRADTPYDVVFSFATHWTDDRNYRVTLSEHMARIRSLLKPGGVLLFETHAVDLGDPRFQDHLREAAVGFHVGASKPTAGGRRALFVIQKDRAGVA